MRVPFADVFNLSQRLLGSGCNRFLQALHAAQAPTWLLLTVRRCRQHIHNINALVNHVEVAQKDAARFARELHLM